MIYYDIIGGPRRTPDARGGVEQKEQQGGIVVI